MGHHDRRPSPLRDELVVLTKQTLVNRCLRLRPETTDLLGLSAEPDRLLMAGVKTALRDLAPPLEEPRYRDQGPQPTDRSPGPNSCTQTRRTPRRRCRTRRAVPGHSRRQRRPNPHRGSLRQTLRRRTPTSQQRTHRRSSPTQPRRRPSSQQRALHRHDRPHSAPPTHPRLRPTPHRRRPDQARNHPLPQALHRPRDLPQPPTPGIIATSRLRSSLTKIGASNGSTRP